MSKTQAIYSVIQFSRTFSALSTILGAGDSWWMNEQLNKYVSVISTSNVSREEKVVGLDVIRINHRTFWKNSWCHVIKSRATWPCSCFQFTVWAEAAPNARDGCNTRRSVFCCKCKRRHEVEGGREDVIHVAGQGKITAGTLSQEGIQKPNPVQRKDDSLLVCTLLSFPVLKR